MTSLGTLIGRGATGSKPAAGTPGALYYDTTLGQLQRDNGSSWDAIEAGGELSGTALSLTGLTGSNSTFRFVGANASGAPASGAHNTNDVALDIAGKQWYLCTAGGTPGTWTAMGGGGGGGSLEVTDGTTDLTSVTKITTTGLIVGGTAGASTLQSHTVQLAKTVLSGGTGTFSFTSIPGGYSALRLIIHGRESGAGPGWGTLRLNSDSSAHYDNAANFYQGGNGGFNDNGDTAMRCAYLIGSGAVASYACSAVLDFPNYAETHFFKTMAGTIVSGDSNNMLAGTLASAWRSTSAITQIDLLDTYAQWSSAALWGLY